MIRQQPHLVLTAEAGDTGVHTLRMTNRTGKQQAYVEYWRWDSGAPYVLITHIRVEAHLQRQGIATRLIERVFALIQMRR